MYWSIRAGTDGIGLDFDFGVFADNMDDAREEAREALIYRGYVLQANKGLYTVHGHPAWEVERCQDGYRIVPLEAAEKTMVGKVRTILTISAKNYAERIKDFTTGRTTLTSAEENER